jgi:hypothetical protein
MLAARERIPTWVMSILKRCKAVVHEKYFGLVTAVKVVR